MTAQIYFGSRTLALNKIKSTFKDKTIVSDINLINFSYSPWFDTNNIYIHNNPNNSEIKIISDLIDKNQGFHILYFEDESFDGRLSLIQKIKKANQIIDCSLPILGDTSSLMRHLKHYNLKNEVLSYIIENCPTIRIKSKTTGRKDLICYDVDILRVELDKLSELFSVIDISLIKECHFKKDVDIFQFIENLFDKKVDLAIKNYMFLVDYMGEQGLLLIMLSQVYFLLRISDVQQNKIFNPNEYIDRIDMKDILGKYLSSDWQETNYSFTSTNSIRARIELDQNKLSFNQLNKILDLLLDTLIDLRSGGSKTHALEIMIYKIAGV